MALILSLETSSTGCSVALHEKGQLINTLRISESQAHATKLATLIHDIVGGKQNMTTLHAVAISAGPGSYTGLRIGTSTAKGICFALRIPLIAVPTLDLLCFQFMERNKGLIGLLCPMIDAKRMEVYCQVVDQNFKTFQVVEAKVIDQTSFGELLNGHKLFFFGDGAEKCKTVISHENAFFKEGYSPEASVLGKIAFERFEKKQVEDLVNFVPFYLKDFIAKKASPVF